MEVSARVVRDPATGEPKEAVIVMRDIIERKLMEEQLLAQALTDGLTGLANRRAFDRDLDRSGNVRCEMALRSLFCCLISIISKNSTTDMGIG
jgi:PleD family two-component response regulator